MPAVDFWPSCGYRLLDITAEGRLAVTDAYLRAALLRPELAPVPESSAPELALHDALLAAPRKAMPNSAIAAIDDQDVAHNYRVWLRFRDRLLAAPTLEAAYLALFREGVDVPPVLVHQLTEVILRHILREPASTIELRAAEMLFRTQTIAVLESGSVMAADTETVELQATMTGPARLGEWLRQAPERTAELDVLSHDNADAYWSRDERHDLALSLNRGQPGLAALCRVLERWIAHFLSVRVVIEPRREIDDKRWVWHVGLDAEASALLNDLYNRVEIAPGRMERLLCLFELGFQDTRDMRAAIAGRPVYLAMAMDEARRLRLKPQNLLLNLPLAQPQ